MAQLVKNPPAMQETWVRKRERLPTPVFWPGEFHELYSPWGHKESDKTASLNCRTCVSIKEEVWWVGRGGGSLLS